MLWPDRHPGQRQPGGGADRGDDGRRRGDRRRLADPAQTVRRVRIGELEGEIAELRKEMAALRATCQPRPKVKSA